MEDTNTDRGAHSHRKKTCRRAGGEYAFHSVQMPLPLCCAHSKELYFFFLKKEKEHYFAVYPHSLVLAFYSSTIFCAMLDQSIGCAQMATILEQQQRPNGVVWLIGGYHVTALGGRYGRSAHFGISRLARCGRRAYAQLERRVQTCVLVWC